MDKKSSFDKTFQETKDYFKIWATERRKVLDELKSIKDEIQRQVLFYSIGSVTYSGAGLVGAMLTIAGVFTAPYTFGGSLVLTVAGAATDVTSSIAGVTHGMVKIGIIMKQCSDAKKSLKEHEATCKEMIKLLLSLKTVLQFVKDRHTLRVSQKKEIVAQITKAVLLYQPIENLVECSKAAHLYLTTGNADEAAKMLNLEKVLDNIVPTPVKDVTKLSKEAIGVIAVVGILFDTYSLISSARDLHSLKNGKLCDEVKRLNVIIEQMQNEYNALEKEFSDKK